MLKLKQVTFSCVENGERFLVQTARTVQNDHATLEIREEDGVFSVWVRTANTVTIGEVSAEFEYIFDESEMIFLNGYQSWTDSFEHSIRGKMRGISHIPLPIRKKYRFSQYGDYNFHDYSGARGELHGWSYGYFRSGAEFRFIGSLAENTGFTKIAVSAQENTVTLEKDCAGLTVDSDYCALKVLMITGTEREVFDSWFELLDVHLNPDVKPLFGYTSWYRHYQNISEDILAADLGGLCSQKHRAEVIQIDDGYQTAVGDWLSADPEKFPNGMKAAADRIRAAQMTPGIWLAPFVCEKSSEIYCNHRDWLLKDETGAPAAGGSNWSGFYALDIYHEEVRGYLKSVFDTVVREWGYRLLKLDFLYAACIVPRPDKTRGTVMADGMALLRKLAGDAKILGCGVPLASAFGKVDYCRIGCDVSLDWNGKPVMRLMHRERVSTRNTVLDTVFRRQLNGRAFLNDPDVFLLRSDNTALTQEQKLCLAEINALCGSVLFTSDNPAEYNDAQCRTLNKILAIRGAEVISASLEKNRLCLCVRFRGKEITRVFAI